MSEIKDIKEYDLVRARLKSDPTTIVCDYVDVTSTSSTWLKFKNLPGYYDDRYWNFEVVKKHAAATASTGPQLPVRLGDIVRCTWIQDRDLVIQGRATYVSRNSVNVNNWWSLSFVKWDIEILERPEPPIEDELLADAYKLFDGRMSNGEGIKSLIRLVRNYDKDHSKNS